jgi:hypothetical protein
MAENKTQPTKISVASFIAKIANETQRADAKALVKLMQDATGEKPTMWGPGIIGFDRYHYKYESGREGDMPLVAFSPRKAATVLYVTTKFPGGEALLGKLGKHKLAGSCLHIKSLAGVDEGALKSLIAKSAAAMRRKYPK